MARRQDLEPYMVKRPVADERGAAIDACVGAYEALTLETTP